MSSGKILLSVLVGASAGALAGILFAPAKGLKTRKRILKKGGNYSDTVKEKFNESLDEITANFNKVKKDASNKTI